MIKAGDVFACGPFTTTALPSFDVETYSEAGFLWDAAAQKWRSPPGIADTNRGLGAVGVHNYVAHPTFELLCLSYDLLDGTGAHRWKQGDPDPALLLDHVRAGKPLAAWNAGFELEVWNGYCVPTLGWPALSEDQLHCDMAKSRASAHPGGLDNAAQVLGTPGKDPDGARLIKKLTMPRNPTKTNPGLRAYPFIDTEDFARLYAYNEQDVAAEMAASLRLPDLSERERRIWLTDLRINRRGMYMDRAGIEACIVIIEQAYAKYEAELRALTNGAVTSASEVQKMLGWMAAHGVTLYELDEDTVTASLNSDMPPAVLRVLRIRQMLAFGSVKKLYAMRAQTCADGRLRDQYVYHGAHTGLWNGRGVQPANLYKGIFSKPEQAARCLAVIATGSLDLVEIEYGDALEAVASCLRSMIAAPPGYRLLSADFTAIQAVATSAIAGEEWRLEVFRTHGKIYEAMAAQLTGRPLEFYADYKKANGKHHEDRQLGKLAALSGDFGAWINGWKRFGADKYGDDKYIKSLIMKTRNAMPMVTELWGGQTRNKFRHDEHQQLYGLEGAAIEAVSNPGQCFGYRGIRYQTFEDCLYCMMPSGGIMRYHAPRLSRSDRQYASPWEKRLTYEGWNSNVTKGKPSWLTMDLYGGVQTQNVISHECREIQADCIMRMEAHGYPVVMHTHDEGVSQVENGHGSLAEYMRLFRQLPDWAVDLKGRPWPIKVPEGWEAQIYGKWED